jgi:hypothetical protein
MRATNSLKDTINVITNNISQTPIALYGRGHLIIFNKNAVITKSRPISNDARIKFGVNAENTNGGDKVA